MDACKLRTTSDVSASLAGRSTQDAPIVAFDTIRSIEQKLIDDVITFQIHPARVQTISRVVLLCAVSAHKWSSRGYRRQCMAYK
jgi:hypothetical protein